MSDFDLNALALFTNSAGTRVVKIAQILDLDPAHDYIVHAVGGTAYFAHHSELKPLPTNAPVFNDGTPVRVSDNAEFYIGCIATVSAPAFRGETFGYNVHLAGTGIPAWIPAKDLVAEDGGEQR